MKKGFTLIELLIVISIIGILAVALLPQILSAPASARDAAKQASLSQLAVALEQYNAANGQYPAAAAAGECMTPVANGGTAGTVQGLLNPFFKNGDLPKIDVTKAFDTAAPAPTTCSGYFYCKFSGNRYFIGIATEGPAASGKGRITHSTANTDFPTCDGTTAVPGTVTSATTNAYGILN